MFNRFSRFAFAASAIAVVALSLPLNAISAQTAAPTAVATQGAFPPPLTADQQVKITFYSYNLASAGVR